MYCTKLSWENIDDLVVNVLNNSNSELRVSRVSYYVDRARLRKIIIGRFLFTNYFHITSNVNYFRTSEYKHFRIKSSP